LHFRLQVHHKTPVCVVKRFCSNSVCWKLRNTMLSSSCTSSLCVVTFQLIMYSVCMFTVQAFAHVNIHRFVELSAVIILCDDDCCFAVDMVLFFLSQWCVCVCVCIYTYVCVTHESFWVCMFVHSGAKRKHFFK